MKQNNPKPKNPAFTNSAGDMFELIPINPLEQQVIRNQVIEELRAAGKPVDPPIYETENAAGEKQRVVIVKREHAPTPELMLAWDHYEACIDEINAEFGRRFQVAVYLNILADPDDYPAWKRRMRLLSIPIPTDEFDKLALFCNTWVTRGPDDLTELFFTATNALTGMTEEKRSAAREMFRRSMEEALQPGSDTEPTE